MTIEHDTTDDEGGEALLGARITGLLGDPSVWSESPTGLDDRIVAAVSAEASTMQEQPQPISLDRERSKRRRGPSLALMVSAAALALVVAGAVGSMLIGGGDNAGQQFALSGAGEATAATASVEVSEQAAGLRLVVDLDGLEPAPPGTYYQAWVKSDDGLVTAGTFHARGGDDQVELWAGVSAEDYPTMTVTLQVEGEGPASSGNVVLVGSIFDGE